LSAPQPYKDTHVVTLAKDASVAVGTGPNDRAGEIPSFKAGTRFPPARRSWPSCRAPSNRHAIDWSAMRDQEAERPAEASLSRRGDGTRATWV